ncbi:hypothetical protein LZ906_017840 (plasmid) [Paraclostridium ghonii]|uniref:hypothetical protein n=1 Tax=Paraclostridium ghonii TaxID=29358 RepID=UPI00202CE618|nr:hypothetical protein [Paeniclostridium ghonii]MCM0167418.1 hypothetical protein [Paeniclostridium ghonii]
MGILKIYEKKYVVYKRITDLTNEDLDVLKKYDLENKIYIYIGQCEALRMEQRTNDFIYKIKNKTDESKEGINIKIETAITYQSIIKFYKEQKCMNQDQVENYLFRSNDCLKVYLEVLGEDDTNAKIEEKRLYHSYMIASKLVNIELLYNKDSQVYQTENAIKLKKTRKKEDLVPPRVTIEGDCIKNEYFLVIDDIRIDIKLSKSDLGFIIKQINLMIQQNIQNNAII